MLYGLDCRGDDGRETLLVDRALDGDVRKPPSSKAARELGGVVTRVFSDLFDGTNYLCNAADNYLREELGTISLMSG